MKNICQLFQPFQILFILKINNMLKAGAFILIVLCAGLVSCGDEKWNEPTDVRFIVDINREAGQGGKLTFSDGYIVLGDFSFDGDRVQGDDVYFTNSYPEGLNINYDLNPLTEDLYFDIPQGTYTKIKISFSTFGSDDDNHIMVEGIYNAGHENVFPVRFEYKAKESFTVFPKNSEDVDEITLKKDNPVTPKIIIDPVYWFQPVSQNLLSDADLVDVDGTQTILINSTTNTDIYNVIAGRIGSGVKIIF